MVMSVSCPAQQDPLYSQYFNNPMLINPAFAGSNERLYLGVADRSQWTGIDGGPQTFNFNGHIALMNNRLGAGALFIQDKTGNTKNNLYGATFAYRIKMPTATLSFGMQVGAIQYASNTDGLLIKNPDPLFSPYTQTSFNTGVGVLLKSDRYTVGFSVPQLISNSVSLGGQSIQVYSQNYYLFGAYTFTVSENVEFKPSTLLRLTKGSSVSADLNANMTFYRKYTGGLFARNLNTFGILLQAVMGNYRLGYVFELPAKGSSLNYNTHEISLSASLDVLSHHNKGVTGF